MVIVACRCAGGHAAESRQRDADRHQWSGGLRQATIETRDPAVPERPTGAELGTQSAQRHGERREGECVEVMFKCKSTLGRIKKILIVLPPAGFLSFMDIKIT